MKRRHFLALAATPAFARSAQAAGKTLTVGAAIFPDNLRAGNLTYAATSLVAQTNDFLVARELDGIPDVRLDAAVGDAPAQAADLGPHAAHAWLPFVSAAPWRRALISSSRSCTGTRWNALPRGHAIWKWRPNCRKKRGVI